MVLSGTIEAHSFDGRRVVGTIKPDDETNR